jgi:hypothetical protein
MKSHRTWFDLVVLSTLSFACKSEEIELRTELFTEMCNQVFSCGCQEYPYLDIAECEQINAIDYAGIEASAKAAGLVVDTACLLSRFPISQYQCRTWSEVYDGNDEAPTCSSCSVAYGAVPLGQACRAYENFDDCSPGLACRGGVCVDPCAPLQAGDECFSQLIECDEGLYCDFATEVCVELPGAGQPCTDRCTEGLYCDFETEVCLKYPGQGQPCPDFTCAAELECTYSDDEADYVCLPLPGAGDPCYLECAGDLYCATDPETFEGLCVVPGKKGDSCLLAPCGPTLVCGADDTCRETPGPGEPCMGTYCSDAAYCDFDNDVCKALPDVGEPCYEGYGCAPGLLCGADDTCGVEPPLICSN